MILTNSGVLKLMQRIKSFITAQLNTKAPSVHTHTLSEIDDLSSLQMGGGYSKSEVDTLLNGKADTSHTHTKSQITDFPTIPSKTSDLTNDSGFITSDNTKIPLSGTSALSGSIIPSADDSYDLGSSTNAFKKIYAKSIRQNVTNSLFIIDGGTDYTNGAELVLYGKDATWTNAFRLFTYDSTNTTRYQLQGMGDTLSWSGTSIIPTNNNTCDLGTSSNKWKTINGVAVDCIGFPSTSGTDVTGSLINYTIGENVYGKYYIVTNSGFASARFFNSSGTRFNLLIYRNYEEMVNNADPMFALPIANSFDFLSLPAPVGSCILIKPESYIALSDLGNTGWTLRIYLNKGL